MRRQLAGRKQLTAKVRTSGLLYILYNYIVKLLKTLYNDVKIDLIFRQGGYGMKSYLEKNRNILLIIAPFIMFTASFPAMWSVFQAASVQTYGITLEESAMLFPMCTAFYGVFYILGGRLQDKFSPQIVSRIGALIMPAGIVAMSMLGAGTKIWQLYLAFCLPFGLGCGIMVPCVITPLLKWFADKNGFAMGICSAGSSVMFMIMVYRANYMLKTFGFSRSLLYIGLMCFVVRQICCTFLVSPDEKYIAEKSALAAVKSHSPKVSRADFTTKEMLKTKQYYMLFLAGFCAAPAYMLIAPGIVTLAVSRGLDENLAVSTVALASGVAAVGKFIVPTVSDKLGRKKCAMIFLSLYLLLSVALMKVAGMAVMVCYIALVFAHGGWGTLIIPFSNDLFGFKYSGSNNGFITLYSTLSSFAMPLMVSFATPFFAENTNHIIGIIGLVAALALIGFIDTDTAKLKK